VLVKNDMAIGYNNRIGPWMGQHVIKSVKESGGRVAMAAYGVGDHGGGPTRRDLINALDMNTWPIFPNIKLSTAKAYFEELEARATRLPVVRGELNTEFTGCYTTQSLIKRANRYGENRLADAELAASLAWAVLGKPYPAQRLEAAWRDVLFSQFHDILPGSGVHDTRAYTHGLYQQTMATTASIETYALRELAARIDTLTGSRQRSLRDASQSASDAAGAGVGFQSADGGFPASAQSWSGDRWPFVIFNPTARDRDEVIEATIWDSADSTAARPFTDRRFAVCDPQGRVIRAQVVSTGKYWGHDYVTVAFPVHIPGLGYAVYTVVEQDAVEGPKGAWQIGPEHHCWYSLVERVAEGLENDLIRVELDGDTGGIRRLLHKSSGLSVIQQEAAAPLLEYLIERPTA
jgi:alpha-mannosidase